MAVVNITINQNDDSEIVIADISALQNDKILCQFYQSNVNIFNISTPNLGNIGDPIACGEGTAYYIPVSQATALRLPVTSLTYKVYRLNDDQPKVVLQEGNVTNTPLVGSDPVLTVNWTNGDRKTETSTSLTLTPEHDVVYGLPTTSTEIVFTLPAADTMVGKKYEIKNTGAGDIRINLLSAAQLILLNAGESVCARAKGSDANDWEVFYA